MSELDLYRALFDTAPDAMLVADQGGLIRLLNPQAEKLFGFAAAELTGQPIEALLPADLRRSHVGHRDRYMSAPRVRPMGAGQELVGQRADGSVFPVEIALSPIVVDGERFFVASIRDISETQRARQALARARYDATLAQIGQLALEAAHGTLLEQVPQRSAETLGLDAVVVALTDAQHGHLQLRAASGLDGASPDLRRWHETGVLAPLFAAGQPRVLTDVGQHSGDPLAEALAEAGFAAAVLVPLFDLGQPMGVLLALSRAPREFDRDVQHFLQSVATVLASAVQRNRTQEQLEHVQRLDAIGQLTGGIAHDFNNLLTVISGNLQLIEPELDGPSLQSVESALRAVARGAELTRKLLAFARKQRLEPRAIDIGELFADLAGMLRPTLGGTVDIRFERPDGLPRVFADRGQLESALVNLALNARDAMPRGGRLWLSARREQVPARPVGGRVGAGDYVVFAVADTGLGMAPDVLARAFEPFFTTKGSGKGSGLGLSIVYGFIKQSGGHMTVDSRLGYGTRIEMFLPVAQADAEADDARGSASGSGGHERILVVEDEPEVRSIALAFLHSLGYRTLAAADAAEALRLLEREGDIDLLFTDVMLGPGRTGVELGQVARELQPSLPVLLTSGYERGAEATPQDEQFPLLRKPYRREELAGALRRLLDRG